MKTRIILATVAAFVISIATSFSASAQSWSGIKKFMNTEKAGELLATLAHPTSDYISSSVIDSDSNTITVKVTFEDWTGTYYSKYILERATNGNGIISRVRCSYEGDFISSFTAWSTISDITLYSVMYDSMFEDDPSNARAAWGASKFSDLSNSAKAAFVMTLGYIEYEM